MQPHVQYQQITQSSLTSHTWSHYLTHYCSTSVTICSDVFRLYKTLQHILLLVASTSRQSWGNFIGCQCDSALNSSWQFWYTKRHGLSPQYLADDCQLTTTTGWRWLWSSNVTACEVPRTRTSLGDRSFTIAGPRLWNDLLLHLRDSKLTLSEFRQLLKMHLFCWGQWPLVTATFRTPYKLTFSLHFTLTSKSRPELNYT